MDLILAVAFVLSWSSGFIGAKLGAGSASAVTTLMWRFLPLLLVLSALALARRHDWRGLRPGDVARQAVIGLLSQVGYLLAVYSAIGLGVSSGTTALIDGTQPLVAGALAGPLLREHVSPRQWLGLVLGLAGVVVVAGADAGATAGVPWWAYAIPFTGMLTLVAATFTDRRVPRAVPALPAMTVQCTTSAVTFAALAAATGQAVVPTAPSFWVAIGCLVLFATFGGYGLYWVVLRRSGVARVNALMFLMAPTTTVWGALMFAEPLGWRTLAGLAVCLVAVVLVNRRPGAARVRGSSRPPNPRTQREIPAECDTRTLSERG